jgi:hypothetical protein
LLVRSFGVENPSPSIDDRALRGAAPESADDVSAAVDSGGARRLAWALAHRARFGDGEASARVEEAVERFATTSYTGLVDIAGALHVHWPEAFLSPRVRAVTSLAIELDVLGARELFMLLQPMLADDLRFDALVGRAERRPLGERMRVEA